MRVSGYLPMCVLKKVAENPFARATYAHEVYNCEFLLHAKYAMLVTGNHVDQEPYFSNV